MDTLTELVRNLALLLLAAAFCELLIPKGRLSSLVRLVFGLLLMAALLQPISTFLGQETDPEQWAQALAQGWEAPADYAQQGAELAQALNRQAEAGYQQDLAGRIEGFAQSQPGVGQAQAWVLLDDQGNPDGVKLVLSASSPESAASCRLAVAAYLGLSEQQVAYEITGEETGDEKE